MLAFTMRSMPHAASTTSSPSGSATSRWIAALGGVDVEVHAAAGEAVGGEVAEHRVGVGHRRPRRRRGRNRPGPGTEPADSGPTSSAPWRTRAIEPPPAPTLCTSTIGRPM